jgi:hypothetical protein
MVFEKITLKGFLNSVAVRIEKDRHREQMAQYILCNSLIYLGGTVRQPPSHGRSHWFNPSTAYHEYQGGYGMIRNSLFYLKHNLDLSPFWAGQEYR